MKTAIYIEDGLTQFVLTAETEIDKKVLSEMESSKLETYRGEFYACQGGWTRWSTNGVWDFRHSPFEQQDHPPQSLIFVINHKKKEEPAPRPIVEAIQETPVQDGCRYHSSPEPETACIHAPLGPECGACHHKRTFGSPR